MITHYILEFELLSNLDFQKIYIIYLSYFIVK